MSPARIRSETCVLRGFADFLAPFPPSFLNALWVAQR
jgi:hypothetical protein